MLPADAFAGPVSDTHPRSTTGTTQTASAATEPEDLPAPARQYIAFLSEQIGVPVRHVGVGPGREQTVSIATA